VPLYLAMAGLPLPVYTLLVAVAVAAGIFLCGRASRELGVHDHPGIVWDEFAGLWICLWAVPPGLFSVALGFLIFRVLDIAKPWPISWCDRRVGGGLGIMLDDVLAGLLGCGLLHLLLAWFPAISGA
jgi:phosphatidylglycerophosphatase A